jgi:hypothetical protein
MGSFDRKLSDPQNYRLRFPNNFFQSAREKTEKIIIWQNDIIVLL